MVRRHVEKLLSTRRWILNHKTAIELLVENINEVEFNRYTLMNLHSALAENLLPNPADAGRVRQYAVDIGKSVYRPLSTLQQIEDALNALLDPLASIQQSVARDVPEHEQSSVLARYGLRPSAYAAWKAVHRH
jgi:fido (protein-threonine AMPylation protein)